MADGNKIVDGHKVTDGNKKRMETRWQMKHDNV